MSSGNIVEIIGAVVDVEFPRESVPKVYDALLVDDAGLTLEVQQQLGDGIVRTIAMGSTDGIKRGVNVSNTGAPISVPVGQSTLGRVMDVLGNPVDEAGPVNADRRTGGEPRDSRNRHQGYRPDHADRQGRQDRPVRRRRRGQDRYPDGADP